MSHYLSFVSEYCIIEYGEHINYDQFWEISMVSINHITQLAPSGVVYRRFCDYDGVNSLRPSNAYMRQ